MPPAVPPITQPKLLLGEGKEEVQFCEALCRFLGITDIQIEQYGGTGGLRPYLRLIPARPGFAALAALAVLRDADNDAAAAFQSVCGGLQAAGLTARPAHGQFAGAAPRVGVFILPDGQRPGMLEDLCLDSVQSHAAIPCVQAFFQCVQQQTNQLPGNMAKARVHAWLASRPVPDRRLGEAAQAGEWPFADVAFAELGRFLQSL